MTYSKKQMMPLIEKYGINPDTNQLFQSICTLFDGQPNYQLWGVKVVFSKAATMETLVAINDWATHNQTMVKLLEKKNIIPYASKTALAQLHAEMANLDKISMVKNIISRFNTQQRKMFNEFLGMSEITSRNVTRNSHFTTLYKMLTKFDKLSSERKKNFINKNSAISSMDVLLKNLDTAIRASYSWEREDLLAFVENNTPDTKVAYDDQKNIVILDVSSYKSSSTLCGGGRTKWCITTSESQWQNYVTSKKSTQYFYFDFSKPENHELAHIGFTVCPKTGITYAHSNEDYNMMGDGITVDDERVNIFKVLQRNNVALSHLMHFTPNNNFAWDAESAKAYIQGKDCSIAYERIIVLCCVFGQPNWQIVLPSTHIHLASSMA